MLEVFTSQTFRRGWTKSSSDSRRLWAKSRRPTLMSRLKHLLEAFARDHPTVHVPDQPMDWDAFEAGMRALQEQWDQEDRERIHRYNERRPRRPLPLKVSIP
jgi:hypothetical protein